MLRRLLPVVFLSLVPMAAQVTAHGVSASDQDLITHGRQLAVFRIAN